MIKKILLAMDGSENAERALWWVIQYAGREKAQVVLFRAVMGAVQGKPVGWRGVEPEVPAPVGQT